MRLCRKPPTAHDSLDWYFREYPGSTRDAIGAESINAVSSVPERREYRTRALLGEKKLAAIAWGMGRLSLVSTKHGRAGPRDPQSAVDGMRCTSGLDVVRFVNVSADPSERLVEAAARFPGRRGQLLRRRLAGGLAKLVVLPVRTPPPMHRQSHAPTVNARRLCVTVVRCIPGCDPWRPATPSASRLGTPASAQAYRGVPGVPLRYTMVSLGVPGIPSPVGAKVRRSQFCRGTLTIRRMARVRAPTDSHCPSRRRSPRAPPWATAAPTRAPTAGAAVGMLKMRVAVLTTPGCGLAPRRRGGHRRLGAPGGGCAGGAGP